MISKKRLILASASPRRRALLEKAGVVFEVYPCELSEPEDKPPGLAAAFWAEALSFFKARAAADEHPNSWILGADTIVVCGGELMGKPRDRADARRMLEAQGGRETQVVTGITLLDSSAPGERVIAHAVTRVWMRDSREEREAYLRGDEWRGKAGAYGIQDVGDRLVERIEGSFSNVVGLPLGLTLRTLQAAGTLIGDGGQRSGKQDHSNPLL